MFKKQYMYVLFIALILLLAACSNESSETEEGNDTTTETENESEESVSEETASDVEQVIKIANDQEPAGLDPHKTPAASSIRVYSKIYEGLVTFDENMEVEGQLAESWEQPDDTTYLFNLIEGVQFHNGREMTAEDVKYSFERILDEETASHIASYFAGIESIEVLGDYQVQFKLAEPDATFLSNLTHSGAVIVPQEVVEENGDLQQVAVGTGPFVFEEWVPDNSVTLTKNENYYLDGIPKLNRIEYYTMLEEASRLSAIRTGEIDMTTVNAQSAELLSGQEGVEIKDYQSLEYSYVGFNVEHEILSDVKVRQALSLATNRQEIVDIAWKGEGLVTGPIAPSMADWSIDVEAHELYSNDVDKAKELLAEAGYADGFDITITTASSYPDMVDTAQLLQQQWKEIGVNAEIQQVEWGEYIDIWSNTSADILVGRNGSGSDPDRAMNYFFHTEGSANVWNFSSDEYDTLVEEARRTIDLDARKEIYVEAQNLLLELSPNLFMVSPKNYVAVRDSVVDYVPYAHSTEDLDEVFKK
ncbi:ABC transporter substrate-binding protein [Oceanobacillus salinisoli]|uniref:ABC transporter substrate-binding protein n=1 Tax=Oceanobacillus salinisoli TaxID=2678611 RepID=UPI0012E0E790|nr:ABC transporter substrate-binding protein [Oceanobacillus salinisoli]